MPFNEGLLENQTMNFTVASTAICIPFLGIIGSADPPVEIRNFTQIRQKILWYNSRIPALAINLQVDDDLFILVLSFSVYLIS